VSFRFVQKEAVAEGTNFGKIVEALVPVGFWADVGPNEHRLTGTVFTGHGDWSEMRQEVHGKEKLGDAVGL